MAYLDASQQTSPQQAAAKISAVIGIHALIALGLVVGLNVVGGPPVEDAPIGTFDVKPKLPPPPPETIEPKPKDTVQPRIEPRVITPTPPIDVVIADTNVALGDLTLPPLTGSGGEGLGIEIGPRTTPTQAPTFDPVSAAPRNDPATWITTDDYRSSWIRREWVGIAGFRLEIAANGTIEQCTITRSTGHNAIDNATCALVSKRAKFQPARGGEGQAVAGSFNGAVEWRLPE
jgi:protein TonB